MLCDCGVVCSSGNYCPVCGECYTDSDYDSKVSEACLFIRYHGYCFLGYRWYSAVSAITGYTLAVKK